MKQSSGEGERECEWGRTVRGINLNRKRIDNQLRQAEAETEEGGRFHGLRRSSHGDHWSRNAKTWIDRQTEGQRGGGESTNCRVNAQRKRVYIFFVEERERGGEAESSQTRRHRRWQRRLSMVPRRPTLFSTRARTMWGQRESEREREINM